MASRRGRHRRPSFLLLPLFLLSSSKRGGGIHFRTSFASSSPALPSWCDLAHDDDADPIAQKHQRKKTTKETRIRSVSLRLLRNAFCARARIYTLQREERERDFVTTTTTCKRDDTRKTKKLLRDDDDVNDKDETFLNPESFSFFLNFFCPLSILRGVSIS